MTEKLQSADRVGIEISVPEDTAPMTIRVMRGDRLVHEFIEPEPSAQLAEPQAEAEQ